MKENSALKKARADAKKWQEMAQKGSSPYIIERFIKACKKCKSIKAKAIGTQTHLFKS